MSYYDDDDIDDMFDRAKARYRQESERRRDRIRREEGYAYDWTQSVIGWIANLITIFTAVWASGCFLSTAVYLKRGLKPTCPELAALRAFREHYFYRSGDTRRLRQLERYYRWAPDVITWIECHADRERLWHDVGRIVDSAFLAVSRGEDRKAYRIFETKVMPLIDLVERIGGT